MQVDGIEHERLREESAPAVSGEAARLLPEPSEPHQIDAPFNYTNRCASKFVKQRLLPDIAECFGQAAAVDLDRARG